MKTIKLKIAKLQKFISNNFEHIGAVISFIALVLIIGSVI